MTTSLTKTLRPSPDSAHRHSTFQEIILQTLNCGTFIYARSVHLHFMFQMLDLPFQHPDRRRLIVPEQGQVWAAR